MKRSFPALFTFSALALLFLAVSPAFSQGYYSGGYGNGCYDMSSSYYSGGYGCNPSDCYNVYTPQYSSRGNYMSNDCSSTYGRGYTNNYYNNNCQPYRAKSNRARQYAYNNRGNFYSSTPSTTPYVSPEISQYGQPTPQQNAERINRIESLLNLIITKLSALLDFDWGSSADGGQVSPRFSSPSSGGSCAGGT